jgi:hypothetical protein
MNLKELIAKRLFVEKLSDERFKNSSIEMIKQYVFSKTGYEIDNEFLKETLKLRK